MISIGVTDSEGIRASIRGIAPLAIGVGLFVGSASGEEVAATRDQGVSRQDPNPQARSPCPRHSSSLVISGAGFTCSVGCAYSPSGYRGNVLKSRPGSSRPSDACGGTRFQRDTRLERDPMQLKALEHDTVGRCRADARCGLRAGLRSMAVRRADLPVPSFHRWSERFPASGSDPGTSVDVGRSSIPSTSCSWDRSRREGRWAMTDVTT